MLFELQLGSVTKSRGVQELLVKLAGPTSPHSGRAAQPGSKMALHKTALCRVFVVFDYENLRRLMSQIRPDNGQKPGNQHRWVVV